MTSGSIIPSPSGDLFVGASGSSLMESLHADAVAIALPSKQFNVVTVNEFGQIIKEETKSNRYFREDLGDGVYIDMMYIPEGYFKMGSPEDEGGRLSSAGSVHPVLVSQFFMSQYSITQAQWRIIAGEPKIDRHLDPDPSRIKGANRPVERVNWHEAAEFCKRLSTKAQRKYHLPSEAEWEYACRGGTTTPFHFGETITPTIANYGSTSTYGSGPKGENRGETTEVGIFPPNAFGLYDIHGNVWEWCQDTWHYNYTGAPTDGSAWVDENDNDYRHITRGGSWRHPPRDCRSAYRRWMIPPNLDYDDIGFRVALVSPSTLP